MDRDDPFLDRGGRVERSCRVAGVLLLIGAVLTYYLADFLFGRSPTSVGLFEVYGLAVRVLAPAGAMLIATSLAARAMVRPYRRPSARGQLIAGVTLLAVGLLQMAFGPEILAAITDVLGATANAGILLVEVLSRVVGLTALPLGIALLAAQPMVRLAQTWLVHTLSTGPPEIESLG